MRGSNWVTILKLVDVLEYFSDHLVILIRQLRTGIDIFPFMHGKSEFIYHKISRIFATNGGKYNATARLFLSYSLLSDICMPLVIHAC